MFDTVIITIPRDKMQSIENLRGRFPAWRAHGGNEYYSKAIKNTFKADVDNGLSCIKLTAYKRKDFNEIPKVNIEFSVPKLIFGDNLHETCEADYRLVITRLKSRLLGMGEIVSEEALENGTISAFHPSKNIVLTENYTASFVAKQLSKININKKFDLTKTIFQNYGQSLQGYTVHHSVVFYDKIADLIRGKRRAVDKDQTPQQLSLFATIKKENPSLEILRFEVRICRKQKLDAVLRKLGFKPHATFKDIFKRDICQKIVRYYWDTLVKGENLFLFGLSQKPIELLDKVFDGEKNIKLKEAIFLIGLHTLCREEGGIRDLRQISEKHTKQRNWYRFSDNIKRLNRLQDKNAVFGWVRQVESAIDRFEPIRTLIGLPEP